MCVCVCVYKPGVYLEDRELQEAIPPPCAAQGSKSGSQVWHSVPLPTDSSPHP